ncbi:MAG: DUF3037 domain-containing protein [Candidatus Kapabacteria bacterium]|jgi:hypothetical protein|nr:DUF3037 domain-containing protein [Candidatus Kapabacteria bacterium]
MNTFISLIQFCPDLARSDVFTVGMIFRSDAHEYYRVEVSESRLKRICRAFGIKDRLLLDAAISGIKQQRYDVAYLQYLHAYENGIIRYTLPKPVATDVPQETFTQLYKIYVADSDELTPHKTAQRVSSTFQKALKKDMVLPHRLSIRYSLDTVLQKYMTSAPTIDFIGGNGSLFCGQMPNMRSDVTLPRFLHLFESLMLHFEAQKLFDAENFHVLINTRYFGSQELKEHRESFRRWQKIKGFTLLEVSDMKEAVNMIRDKVEAKDVQPFDQWLMQHREESA